VIQVSTESDNKAFTNRVWEDRIGEYTISDSKFYYTYSTEPDIFGLAIDLTDVELAELPTPIVPTMCTKNSDNDRSLYGLQMQYTPEAGTCTSDGDNDRVDAKIFRNSLLGINESQRYEHRSGLTNTHSGQTADDYKKVCDWADDPSTCESSISYCTYSSSSSLYPSQCNGAITCVDNYCDDGPLDGLSCTTDSDCWAVECFENRHSSGSGPSGVSDHCGMPVGDYRITRWDTVEDSIDRMNQIFALSYDLLEYQGWDAYDAGSDYYERTSNVRRWDWDITDGSGDYAPVPPTVVSVGECFGSECLEGTQGRITVNNVDASDLSGAGTMNATSSFYMYADEEQMPIRTVIMDWGDGDEFNDESDWPTDGQYGSSATDNRYKNHRGLTGTGSSQTDICGRDTPSHFGVSEDGCSQSYVSFNNDYVCSTSFLLSLQSTGTGRTCEIDEETGNLINSPCYGGDVPGATENDCVFQPRVFVQDNWGWCASSNEVCDAGDDYSDEYCYGGDANIDSSSYFNECDYQNCPGDDCLISPGETADPWVYFDGFIIVEAE
jgi:hypothetical protein